MKFWLGLCCCLVLIVSAAAQYEPLDFVPDQSTAIRVAEAVLIPVYGEKHVVSERPYRAELDGDVWTVTGTLWCTDENGHRVKGRCVGGTATVKIAKSDGRILSMIHTK